MTGTADWYDCVITTVLPRRTLLFKMLSVGVKKTAILSTGGGEKTARCAVCSVQRNSPRMVILPLLALVHAIASEREVLPDGTTSELHASPEAKDSAEAMYLAQAKLHLEEFVALDRDGNGSITEAEFNSHQSGFGQQALDAWDSDGDQQVSLEEYHLNDIIWQSITLADANANSKLEQNELALLHLPGLHAFLAEHKFHEPDLRSAEVVSAAKFYLNTLRRLYEADHPDPTTAGVPNFGSWTIAVCKKADRAHFNGERFQGADLFTRNMQNARRDYHPSTAYGHFSRVVDRTPDTKVFPDFFLAKPFTAHLKKGDCLIIPRGWWHWVASHGRSYSANFWGHYSNVTLPEETPDIAHDAAEVSSFVGLDWSASVPRFSQADHVARFSKMYFKAKHAMPRVPAVLEGLADDWPATKEWTDEVLADKMTAAMNSLEAKQAYVLSVKNSPDPEFYTLHHTRNAGKLGIWQAKTSFSEITGKEETRDGTRYETPQDFFFKKLEEYNAEKNTVTAAREKVVSKYLTTVPNKFLHHNEPARAALMKDCRPPSWLPSNPETAHLWINPPNQKTHDTGLHYDDYDSILVQIEGEKTVTIWSPAESHALYPRIQDRLHSNNSAAQQQQPGVPSGRNETVMAEYMKATGNTDTNADTDPNFILNFDESIARKIQQQISNAREIHFPTITPFLGCDCSRVPWGAGAAGACPAVSWIVQCANFVVDTGWYGTQVVQPAISAKQMGLSESKRLPSSAMLWWAMQATDAPPGMFAYVKAMQDAVGPNQIVWSMKNKGNGEFNFELYFFGWSMSTPVQSLMQSDNFYSTTPNKTTARLLPINQKYWRRFAAPEFASAFDVASYPPVPEGHDMECFSFDMHPDFFLTEEEARAQGKVWTSEETRAKLQDSYHIYTVKSHTTMVIDAVPGYAMSLDPTKAGSEGRWLAEQEWILFWPSQPHQVERGMAWLKAWVEKHNLGDFEENLRKILRPIWKDCQMMSFNDKTFGSSDRTARPFIGVYYYGGAGSNAGAMGVSKTPFGRSKFVEMAKEFKYPNHFVDMLELHSSVVEHLSYEMTLNIKWDGVSDFTVERTSIYGTV